MIAALCLLEIIFVVCEKTVSLSPATAADEPPAIRGGLALSSSRAWTVLIDGIACRDDNLMRRVVGMRRGRVDQAYRADGPISLTSKSALRVAALMPRRYHQ